MARTAAKLGNSIAPPRFVGFLALFALGVLAHRWFWPETGWHEALALSFDLAAALFLLSLLPLLRDSTATAMRRHAAENDANRVMILLLTTMVGLGVMGAIAGELAASKAGDHAALVKLVGTLALIWLFCNSVYALHYAHAFYLPIKGANKDSAGLDFPGTGTPDYADFAYFAFTLGMTFQTSDVTVTAPGIRRIVLLHSLAAFVFNIGVIAFVINALG